MHKEADRQSDLNHDPGDCPVGARSAGRDQQAGERHVLGASAGEGAPLGGLCRVPREGAPLPDALDRLRLPGGSRLPLTPCLSFSLFQDEKREFQHGSVCPGIRNHGQRRDDGRDRAGAAAPLHPLRGPGTSGVRAGPGERSVGVRGLHLHAADAPSRLESPPGRWTNRDSVWVS